VIKEIEAQKRAMRMLPTPKPADVQVKPRRNGKAQASFDPAKL
jgi:hypothetical protein